MDDSMVLATAPEAAPIQPVVDPEAPIRLNPIDPTLPMDEENPLLAGIEEDTISQPEQPQPEKTQEQQDSDFWIARAQSKVTPPQPIIQVIPGKQLSMRIEGQGPPMDFD